MTSGGSSTHRAQASRSQDPEFGRESGSDNEVGEPPASKRHKAKDLTVVSCSHGPEFSREREVDEPPASKRHRRKDLTVKTGVQNLSRKSPGVTTKV